MQQTSVAWADPLLEEGKARHESPALAKDHFINNDGEIYAGRHILIDIWGGKRLDDLNWMEQSLYSMIEISGATLLHIHLHHFTPNDGISGVAVLAESHISVHTWPECGFCCV